jgi:uncharacterized Zn-binding protein involved in type VI secretion
MQPFIVVGDKTSHGGTVLGGASTATTMNRSIARVGDKVSCPKCGENTIATGDSTMIVMGHPVARQGDKTACGATLVSSQSVTLAETSSSGVSPSISDAEDAIAAALNSKDQQTYDRAFLINNNQTGKPLPNTRYRLTLPNGTTVEGLTDTQGLTQRIAGASAYNVRIEVYV